MPTSRGGEPCLMRHSLAWTLQFLALVIVGAALLIGLAYDALRVEVTMLAVGGGMFLLGRWLEKGTI